MAGKMMELLVSLKGQIDKSVPESVRKAMDDTGNLQKKQGELKGTKAGKFKVLEQAAQSLGEQFNQAKTKTAQLEAEFKRNQADLKRISDELHRAGFNTQQFAASQDALRKKLGETTTALAQVNRVKAQYDEQQAQ